MENGDTHLGYLVKPIGDEKILTFYWSTLSRSGVSNFWRNETIIPLPWVGIAKIKIAKIVNFDRIAKINGRENI